MQRWMRTIGAGALAATVCLGASAQAESNDRSRVVTTEIRACRASLEYGDDETLLDYDNGCPQSVAEKAVVLDTLLSQMFGDGDIPGSVRSVRTGWLRRLSEELAREMALQAHESEQWRALLAARQQMGPGDHGMVGPFIARLIDEQGLFRPINQTLQLHGAMVVAFRIEKPVVGLPSMTGSEHWLLGRGVAADRLLPIDAIVWLVLERSVGSAPLDAANRP